MKICPTKLTDQFLKIDQWIDNCKTYDQLRTCEKMIEDRLFPHYPNYARLLLRKIEQKESRMEGEEIIEQAFLNNKEAV